MLRFKQICTVLAVLISLVACNSSAAENIEPTPTLFDIPTLSPTQMLTQPAPEVSPTPLSESLTDVLDLQKLNITTLNSYASTFMMSWSGTDEANQPIEGSYTVNTDYSRDPYLRRVWWQSTATAVPNATFDLLEIGDDAWMLMGDETDQLCLSGSREELGAQDAPYTPDYWLSDADLSALHRILPDEQVDGIIVQHYQMTGADQAPLAGYSDYSLDVYVDASTGDLVRQSFSADGPFTDFATGSGHLEWTFELYAPNTHTPDVTPPSPCEGG